MRPLSSMPSFSTVTSDPLSLFRAPNNGMQGSLLASQLALLNGAPLSQQKVQRRLENAPDA